MHMHCCRSRDTFLYQTVIVRIGSCKRGLSSLFPTVEIIGLEFGGHNFAIIASDPSGHWIGRVGAQ